MTLINGRSRQAKARKERHAKAVAFFFQHAGFGYDPKTQTSEEGHAQCAERLAQAEEYAFNHGWECIWNLGDECIGCECGSEDCACSTGAEHEVWFVTLVNETGTHLESLGSICNPTREYNRVIEAELALEAMPQSAIKL